MAVVLAASVSPAQAFKHPNLRNTRFMTEFRPAKLRAAARRPSEAVGARSDRRVASAASNNIDLAQFQVANYNEMSEMLEKLLEEHAQLDEEELTKRVAAVEEISVELGFNKVVPELNDGLFSAQPLAGRLKKVTGPQAALTLGGLTFGAVRPADLELAFRPLTSEPPIFKGELNGVPASYTVTSAFAVPGQDLAGICKAVGSYVLDDQNPQRLTVTFTEVCLLPDFGEDKEKLGAWVELFQGANPAECVDAGSGTVRIPLEKPASAQLDYLVMAPGWQMTRSNFGSIALLRTAPPAGAAAEAAAE